MNISTFIISFVSLLAITQFLILFLIKKKKISEITLHWIDLPWLLIGGLAFCMGVYKSEIERDKEQIDKYINFRDFIFNQIKFEIYDQDYYCKNSDFKIIKLDSSLNDEENNRILCRHIAKIKNLIDTNEEKIKNNLVSMSYSNEDRVYLSEIGFKKEFVGSEEVKKKYNKALEKINKLSSFDSLDQLKIEIDKSNNELIDKKKKSKDSYFYFQIFFILLLSARLGKFTAELLIKKSKQKQEKQA